MAYHSKNPVFTTIETTGNVDVNGTVELSSTSSTDLFLSINTTASNSYAYIKGAGETSGGTTRSWRMGYSPDDDRLVLAASASIDNAPCLEVDYSTNNLIYTRTTDGVVFEGTRTGGATVDLFCNTVAGWLGTGSNHPLQFYTNNSTAHMTLTTGGSLGIGTTSPTANVKFESVAGGGDQAGSFYRQTSTNGNFITSYRSDVGSTNGVKVRIEADGDVVSNGVTLTSDERAKKEITPIEYGLAELLQLNPIRFRWNHETSEDVPWYSVATAQELQSIMPEMVRDDGVDMVDSEGNKFQAKAIYNMEVLAVAVKAIQELKIKNDELEARLAALEGNK